MGMLEDRKNAACDTIMHSERMYRETRNAYFALNALFAARWGEFTPPEWAISRLLDAVESAMRRHHRFGERISIDAELGLTVSRGQSPKEKVAYRASRESASFRLVQTIHACFDVSIPIACEAVFYAICKTFSVSCEERYERFSAGARDRSCPRGVTSDQWDELRSRSLRDANQSLDAAILPDLVKSQIRLGHWWSITHGDMLGYSLERFIERFYRKSSALRKASSDTPLAHTFFYGWRLLRDPAECAKEITLANEVGYQLRAVSLVASFPLRAEFEAFLNRLPSAFKKDISDQ